MSRPAVALIACVVLASCGGDDGGGSAAKEKQQTDAAEPTIQASPSAPAPTGGGGSAKARYIARIDALCRSANARLLPIRGKLAKIDSGRLSKGQVFTQYQELLDQAATINDNVLGQVENVPPPAGDRAAIERIQALLERQSRLLHGFAAAAGRRDAAEIKRLNAQLGAVKQVYRARAQAYGFRYCGRSR
jgi:hypothetical protein